MNDHPSVRNDGRVFLVFFFSSCLNVTKLLPLLVEDLCEKRYNYHVLLYSYDGGAIVPQENFQKIKLLKLVELLRQETDEDHPMRTGVICDRLRAMSITCDRRTLHRDMKMLNEHGYEVMKELIEHEMVYYISDRSFSIPELKILIDAVQAASFITEKKSNELIDKIAALGGSHRAQILKGNIVRFNSRKHSNEAVYYSVGFMEEAIQNNRKIIFRYFDLNETAEKVYRRDGHHYVVEPIGLVFNEDNYYLVCYSAKHNGTANYRVDRMDSVEILEEEISNTARSLRDNLAGMTESAFKMFGGQTVDAMLEFDDCLIGVVYDKFGEGTTMHRTGEHTVAATVKVQVSPTFFGWLFQFGDKMTILSPISLKIDYLRMANTLHTIQ